jgi:hypothetical protein
MKFSPDHSLFFVHIPKAAGSALTESVRGVLRQPTAMLARDLPAGGCPIVEGRGRNCVMHPELGPIHLMHLQLPVLETHFPATYETLRKATSFAIVREPRARFISALQQRLRETKGLSVASVTNDVLVREGEAVCAWLEGRDLFTDLDYVHFTRQCDYVAIGRKRIVDEVFAVEQMADVRRWLTARHGIVPTKPARENRSMVTAGWVRRLPPSLIAAYRRGVPEQAKSDLRRFWKRSGVLKPASAETAKLVFPDDIETFIATYYAEDAALHAAQLPGAPGTAAD